MKRRVLIIIGGLLVFCCGLTALIGIIGSNRDDAEAEPVAQIQPTQEDDEEEVEPTQKPDVTEPEATKQKPTDTAVPTDTSEPTSTNTATAVPTNTSTPTRRPANTPRPTNTPRPQVRITTSSVNLRAGPGANYDVVDTAVAGDTLIVIASNQAGDWYNVALSGSSGSNRAWVSASVVETVGSFDVDVARTIPAPPVVAATSPPQPQPTAVQSATSTLPPAPAPTQPPAPPPLPGGVPGFCTCTGPDLNCGDFSSHNQAQACHDYCEAQGYGDVYDIDGNDDDGLACESLP